MSAAARTILVVEDRPTDRLYLTTLLGYGGFTVLEASSGDDGLAIAITACPDLVISDVLMPNMDGYEFVRRLRRLPNCTDVPVMFYTATYHETEARQLAEECGVFEVLIKPSEPGVILARVDSVLSRDAVALEVLTDEVFDKRHGRLTSETLMDKVRKLEASERRMAALVRLGQQFMAERDPGTLLRRACDELRDATESRSAVVGLLAADHSRFTLVISTAGDVEWEPQLMAMASLPAPLQRVVHDRIPLRGRAGRRVEDVDLGLDLESYLIIPLMSADHVLGLMAVADKVAAPEFSTADEQFAVTLGVQAGTAYENALLIDRLRTQASELREREETTEFALNAAGIGVYERGFEDGHIRISGAVRRLLGVSAGHPLHDLGSALRVDEADAGRAVIEQALKDGGDFTFDLAIGEDTATRRYLQARGRIQSDDSGQPRRMLSVLIDMTERRSLEDQLRQAQKMEAIGLLAGGVAHDFNNLLTVIQGYARFLTESALDEEQRRDALAITAAGERAVSLTRQLLAFSRRQPRDIAVFDVDNLIKDIAGMLGRLIGEHIILVTSLGNAGTIENDRGQIEQVVMNLVVNARDAMPSGGVIRLETSRIIIDDAAWVRLVIADTGVGMSEETKARIFEPFFTTKDAGKGTGLGLATVFGIVAQSEGRIDVESEVGAGSSFTILLPTANDRVTEQAIPAAGPQGGHETVLIVEDNEAIRELVVTMLTRVGYQVTEVGSASEALSLDLSTIDVLVTDVLMPGGMGPQLVAEARLRRPNLPVVYLSGYAPDDTLGDIADGEPTTFLPKPFTLETLTQKIREVLDR